MSDTVRTKREIADQELCCSMFIPIEDPRGFGDQYIWVVDKDEKGDVTKKKQYGVRYVPLTDAPK